MEETQPAQPLIITPQTEASPVISGKKQIPWLIIGLTILLIFSLGTTGYFAYQNHQLKKEAQTLSSKPSPTKSGLNPAPTVEQLGPTSTITPSDQDQADSQSSIPPDWKKHEFPSVGLILYFLPNYKSDLEEFPENNSRLIRFWQGISADTATVQLDIKSNWNSTGNAKDLPRYFLVAGTIPAAKVDPPLMEDAILDRYQTNYYFEHEGKVYVLTCVHNWITEEYQACEKMLQTMKLD